MTKRIFPLLVSAAIFFGFPPASSLHAQSSETRAASVALSVRTSPEAAFATRLELSDRDLAEALKHAAAAETEFAPLLTDVYVETEVSRPMALRLDITGNLWSDAEGKRFLLPEKWSDKLRNEALMLRQRHYGELLSWEEAKSFFPLKSTFQVRDAETGLTFRVQRRAGRTHADVQPLTREDTAVMKKIYQNRWSWKRKAVIVSANGRNVAASMNGMPHGGDGIPENGFSGHFCIHFLHSTTHRADSPDPAHQLMVVKAAGRLRPYFESSGPALLAQSMIEAANHREAEIVRLLTEGMPKERSSSLIRELDAVTAIRTEDAGPKETEDGALNACAEWKAVVYRNREKSDLVFRFAYFRQSPLSPWRLREMTADPA